MKKLLLFIVCLTITLTLSASVSNMIVEHYTVEHGLPNNAVSCTLKDKDGFVWLGTWYGLCRFDGQKFYTYNKQQTSTDELPPRKIQHIVEDKKQNLWVKTIDHKLYVFNKKTEQFHAIYDDMKNYSDNIQVVKMHTNAHGEVLLLTLDRNLLLAEADNEGKVHITILYDSQKKQNDNVFRLQHNVVQETDDYLCWIGVDDKISAFKKSDILTSKRLLADKLQLSAGHYFTCIHEDGNRIWLGDNKGVFLCVDPLTGAVDQYALPNLNGTILNLLVIDNRHVYVTIEGKGTCLYDLITRQLTWIKLPLFDNTTIESFADHSGFIWFHETNNALVYYNPSSGKSYRYNYRKGAKLGYGTLYFEDYHENGAFFLTPFGEALYFDREEQAMIRVEDFKQILHKRSFFHIYKDTDGIIWMASTDGGIYRIDFPKQPFNLYELTEEHSSERNGIRALFQSKNGDIWISTRKSELYCFDGTGSLKYFWGPNKAKLGIIYHIMEDTNGNLWFSTKGDGLIKAMPDQHASNGYNLIHYKHDPNDLNTINGKNVYFTHQDTKGRIWVGVFDGGLNLIEERDGKVLFYHKDNSFTNYPSYGLYTEVRNIVEDKNNRLWIGTTDGLMSLDLSFDSPNGIDFSTYRMGNGAGLTESDVYALYKDSNHDIWACFFGGGVHKIIEADHANNKLLLESYGIDQGLVDDVIVSMIEDSMNNLWLVSNSGIASLDKKTGQIRNFDEYDGFPKISNEEGVILRTQSNELCIGCRQGVLKFSPEHLVANKVNYNTFIVNCQINNQHYRQIADKQITDECITYSDEMVLEYNQSMFTL